MKKFSKLFFSPRTPLSRLLCLALLAGLVVSLQSTAEAQQRGRRGSRPDPYPEENNQIRRDKMDVVLPKIMRERGVDMWIHVARQANNDAFAAEELGSSSGTFVFTDRGGDRIERAIIGRRWGATQRQRGAQSSLIEESGVYDIIAPAVFVGEPISDPTTEYDFRFEGLREFVEERTPQTIAVNFRE